MVNGPSRRARRRGLRGGQWAGLSRATATAVLAVTDVYNYPAGVCHRVTAAGLRVIPPNQFTSKLVPYPIGACSASQVFMQAGVAQKQQ